MDIAQHLLDLVAMRVEFLQPVVRGTLVMRARSNAIPSRSRIPGILPDQMMARHDPAGEEMLRNPVLAISAVEQIGARPVREDVHEEASAGLQP